MFKEKKTRDAVIGHDVMGPKIGGSVGKERPREECPGCSAKGPKLLDVDDFPGEHRQGVQQAMADGADLYECRSCAKRWAVLRQKIVKTDGVVSLEPVRRAPPPGSPPRKYRRAQDAHNARVIRRNVRLAGADVGEEPARVIDADEARKARNARKAAKKARS